MNSSYLTNNACSVSRAMTKSLFINVIELRICWVHELSVSPATDAGTGVLLEFSWTLNRHPPR